MSEYGDWSKRRVVLRAWGLWIHGDEKTRKKKMKKKRWTPLKGGIKKR